MARRILEHVDSEVSRVWGAEPVWQSGVPIDADDAVYTRNNIRHWLLRWHELGQLAARSLKWARVQADIDMVISSLPESLRDFHELYYVIGYTPAEVLYVMEWQRYQSFVNACNTIERRLCAQLLDRRLRRIVHEYRRNPLPDVPDCPMPVVSPCESKIN